MHNRHHEPDMAHALATHLLLGHLHAATVADDALVADALVLAAIAFVVLHGAENALAKKTVALRFVRTVVDGLRLQNLAVAPFEDVLRRSEREGDGVERLIGPIGFLFKRHMKWCF